MKNNTRAWLALSVAAVAGIGGLTACTSSVDFLKSMSLSITQINGQEYFQLNSDFDLGSVSLANATISIPDPTTGLQAGQVSFGQLANGQSQISLSANTNLIPKSSAALGLDLPNGKPIPSVLGAANGDVLGIQIATHSILYLGGNTATTAYVGVALGIEGFDAVMNDLSTSINVFFMGTWNNVLGVGGIYGSNIIPNESGIAIFGKYTAPVATSALRSLAISHESKAANHPKVENDYAIEKLNNYNSNRLMKFFYGKKRVLKVY